MSSGFEGGPPSHYSRGQSQDSRQGYGEPQGYRDDRGQSDSRPPSSRRVSMPSGDYSRDGARSPQYALTDSARADASSRKRPPWLAPVIIMVAALVVLGGGAGIVYAVGQNALQAPLAAATAFCNDLKAQKYDEAYAMLSSGYQARVNAKDFAQLGQLHDQLDGKVKQCGPAGIQNNGGFNLNLNPQDASFNAQITRNRSYTGTMSLVKQNDTWKIDAVDDALQGSDVGALETGARFCDSLASQKYADVYAMFTPAYQKQIGSVDGYVKGLKQVFGDGQFQITGCQPQLNTFTVTAQGDSASLSGAFNIKVTTGAGALTVPVPFKIAFAKISGAWKISDLEVVQSQG